MPAKRKKPTKKHTTDVRELLENASGKHFARRRVTAKTGPRGSFKSMVSVGKSLAKDRKTKAKRRVKRGQGDKGDVA